MPYEQLIESVEVSAEEKIKDLREKANRDAAEILNEAAGKDELIKKRHLDAVKRTVELERHKSLAKINEERRMQVTRVKDELFWRAFADAKDALRLAREHAKYGSSFRKMLEEAVLELEGDKIQLHIDKRDEDLCRKVVSELRIDCDVITDITTLGGLNASTKDGKFVVLNTIESRFERAKVQLKPEIFTALYGGQGGM